MRFIEAPLLGVILIEPVIHRDSRGFFSETFRADLFAENGISGPFVQDNHSLSASPFVLRGLHFQKPPHAQAKLIRVIKGAVFDVVVDLRRQSRSFGKWESFRLDTTDFRQLYIPRGFAHGFCTLEPDTEFEYKVDNIYNRESEAGIRWDDPDLAIDWPTRTPVLSDKDRTLPLLKEFSSPF